MAAELFLFNAGIRMTHVSYRGEAPAIADVLAGPGAAGVRQRLGGDRPGEVGRASGACRHLAQARARPARRSDTRRVRRARTPTSRRGSASPRPAATPREIVQRLNAEVLKALAAPDLQRRFAELSLSVTPSSPEELDALIKSEAVRWGEVIRACQHPRAGMSAARLLRRAVAKGSRSGGGGYDPIALELFKNAIFSIADEMALTVFRTTYSGVLEGQHGLFDGLRRRRRQAGGAGPDPAGPSRLGADRHGIDHAPLRATTWRRATSSS